LLIANRFQLDCDLEIWLMTIKLVVYFLHKVTSHSSQCTSAILRAQVDCDMTVGIVDVTSITAPCIKMRNPPVDLAVSGVGNEEYGFEYAGLVGLLIYRI
jgi:hypothetical protein